MADEDHDLYGDTALRELYTERRTLLNLAYRMLGSSYDAEDVMQETYIRWYELPAEQQRAIKSPMAWLVTVAGRICLDHLASARVRRERYTGEWLPEPLPGPGWASTGARPTADDPAEQVTLDESVTMGVLVVLDTVTPAERVAFVLHDVFGVPFPEIAETVGRTPAACRQLATSARRRIRAAREPVGHPERQRQIVSAFKDACRTGDTRTLVAMLDPQAAVHVDGGGRVRTALRPVSGADKVARYLVGVVRRQTRFSLTECEVSGRPGLVGHIDGHTVAVAATQIDEAGLITHIWLMMNPDKMHAWHRGDRPLPGGPLGGGPPTAR